LWDILFIQRIAIIDTHCLVIEALREVCNKSWFTRSHFCYEAMGNQQENIENNNTLNISNYAFCAQRN
jgi:hypothetical protein